MHDTIAIKTFGQKRRSKGDTIHVQPVNSDGDAIELHNCHDAGKEKGNALNVIPVTMKKPAKTIAARTDDSKDEFGNGEEENSPTHNPEGIHGAFPAEQQNQV